MTTELIIKGALLGLGFFFVCRACYYNGYKDGFKQGGEFVLGMWRNAIERSKEKSDKNTEKA